MILAASLTSERRIFEPVIFRMLFMTFSTRQRRCLAVTCLVLTSLSVRLANAEDYFDPDAIEKRDGRLIISTCHSLSVRAGRCRVNTEQRYI